jgi:hypothetical protein
MFGQDGNWNFAPMMEEADISNTRYSSFWAESMSANIAPYVTSSLVLVLGLGELTISCFFGQAQ